MKKLFIDTGVWIALNNSRDIHHVTAVNANKDFLDEGYFYVSTDYVLDETYTFLLNDVGHKRAVIFGDEIKSLQDLRKIKITHINIKY